MALAGPLPTVTPALPHLPRPVLPTTACPLPTGFCTRLCPVYACGHHLPVPVSLPSLNILSNALATKAVFPHPSAMPTRLPTCPPNLLSLPLVITACGRRCAPHLKRISTAATRVCIELLRHSRFTHRVDPFLCRNMISFYCAHTRRSTP